MRWEVKSPHFLNTILHTIVSIFTQGSVHTENHLKNASLFLNSYPNFPRIILILIF